MQRFIIFNMDVDIVNKLHELASVGIVVYTGSMFVLTDHAHEAAYAIQSHWRARRGYSKCTCYILNNEMNC